VHPSKMCFPMAWYSLSSGVWAAEEEEEEEEEALKGRGIG
jgi:hypothetical protein